MLGIRRLGDHGAPLPGVMCKRRAAMRSATATWCSGCIATASSSADGRCLATTASTTRLWSPLYGRSDVYRSIRLGLSKLAELPMRGIRGLGDDSPSMPRVVCKRRAGLRIVPAATASVVFPRRHEPRLQWLLF